MNANGSVCRLYVARRARQQLHFAPLLTFRSPGYRYLWLASVLWNQARAMDHLGNCVNLGRK
jgi:hypothetical protein